MKSVFDRMNLRPHERRLVVVVGMIIFVILNMWFVWPYFDDWGQVETRMDRSRDTLQRYQAEIAKRDQYQAKLEELKSTGSEMLTSELELQKLVQAQAAATGFQIISLDPRSRLGSSRTNQFFQEQALTVNFNSGGKELIDFLVGIASANAMVRVREMNIKPDASQTRLNGHLVLVGNYQRRTTNAPAATTAPRRQT